MADGRRYEVAECDFPVTESLQAAIQSFVDWLCDHADEIAVEEPGIMFELLCREQELEGDIRAARYAGGIDGYAAAVLEGYYTHGGILED